MTSLELAFAFVPQDGTEQSVVVRVLEDLAAEPNARFTAVAEFEDKSATAGNPAATAEESIEQLRWENQAETPTQSPSQ